MQLEGSFPCSQQPATGLFQSHTDSVRTPKDSFPNIHFIDRHDKWLTLLRILEVPGSNFGLETGYPD
jgi:hypothetical protein